MNAIDMLKKQHLEVSDLFARFDATSDKKEKRAIFEKIASALVAHDTIEREIFYPACEREMGKGELLGEAVVEHGVVEFMIHRADQNSRKEAFDDRRRYQDKAEGQEEGCRQGEAGPCGG